MMDKQLRLRNWFLPAVLVCFLLDFSETQTPTPATSREHKVHNIMLYPEKHSWCKPTPIKQVVTHPGCRSMDMENNICVGACFSFSVPRTVPETPGDDQLYYCDSCQPHSVSWTTVLLECPNTPTREPVSKMVEVITNCSCNTFRNIGMYENQLSSSSFSSDEDDDDGGGGGLIGQDKNNEEEEEDEEDNSLPEINDFITRHEKLKLKPILLTPMVLSVNKKSADGARNDVHTTRLSILNQANTSTSINSGNTNSSSSSVSSSSSETPSLAENPNSTTGTTSSPDNLPSKFTHSDQMLQFQDLSGELVDEPELEDEEVIEEP